MGAIKTPRHTHLSFRKGDTIACNPLDLANAFRCLKDTLKEANYSRMNDYNQSSEDLFRVYSEITNRNDVRLSHDDMLVLCNAPADIKRAYNETTNILDPECNQAVSKFINNMDGLIDNYFGGDPIKYLPRSYQDRMLTK